MKTRGLSACALLMAAAVLLVPTLPEASAAVCPPLGGSRALQNDAGSGRDAGDTTADPVEAPLRSTAEERAYHWGILEPSLHNGGADADDWFFFTMPAGGHELRVQGVVAKEANLLGPLPPEASPFLFTMDLYAPGDLEPTYIWRTDGTEHAFAAEPGAWLLHVTPPGLEDASTCAPAGGGAGQVPRGTYGLYLGCDPICIDALGQA